MRPIYKCHIFHTSILLFFVVACKAHFEFSRDEEKRAQQLKILETLRDESIRAQETAHDVKRRKRDIMQQRLARIRQRKVRVYYFVGQTV